jgi:hypothetical protein
MGPSRQEREITSDAEQREVDAAAAEAARIGGAGGPNDDAAGESDDAGGQRGGADPAQAPLEEAGGGEAEGFEQAEAALIEHASHGDQQSAHAVLRDRERTEEDSGTAQGGEADHERSSEYAERDADTSSGAQP